jgi:thymidylate kinase
MLDYGVVGLVARLQNSSRVPMKIVLAIEGTDGAGKSSLACYIQDLCQQFDCRCSRIGRRTGSINQAVAKITQVIGEETGRLTPQAEVYLRLAREFQRAHSAAMAPAGVVVLDRFVLTLLAQARVNGLEVSSLTRQLKEIVDRADLHATIFVGCPFEQAWERVRHRNEGMRSNRWTSEKILRQMAQFMEEEFRRGALTGQQWPVENAGTLAEAEEQVNEYLAPHLSRSSLPRTYV